MKKLSKSKLVLIIAVALMLISMVGTACMQGNWGKTQVKTYYVSLNELQDMIRENNAETGKDIQITFSGSDAQLSFMTLIPKTASEILKLTKAMFSFSQRIYKTIGNPFEYVRRPKLKRTAKGFWTPEEINAILAAAPSTAFRKFWALMAFAGLRYFEARDLRWKDVSGDKITLIGKGDKLATVPLSERLKNELGEPGNPDETIVASGTFANNTTSIRTLRTAVISVDGSVRREIPLTTHRGRETIAIETAEGRNTIVIDDSAIAVTDADCPDRICVKTGPIRKKGEVIACLPHRLLIEIR